MERQNVTLSLPKALLQRVKVQAAREGKSFNALCAELLEERLRRSSGYQKAQKRQLRYLEEGFDLGTKGLTTSTREDLHERR